ncbi:hypothetical protein L3X38_038018 [Prunus dulcis]|uniref:Uncharacterized protein n=1 Tax=Prunus dulcis TaxID=3755 RepID=A0AAD4YR54_PRUDU|nr:hypothetical protein L3X38_038018 [Prunus dulcis]
MFSAINARLDQIFRTGDSVSSTFNGGRGRTFGSGFNILNSSTSYLPKMVKLDFPHFNGLEDLTRDAQLCFQVMKEENSITTWTTFKQGLHNRNEEIKDFATVVMRSLVLVIGEKNYFSLKVAGQMKKMTLKMQILMKWNWVKKYFLKYLFVLFMVDSGSTHNFLSNKVAKKASVNATGYGKFKVSITNGEMLTSVGLCKGGVHANPRSSHHC